jgi:hypothetical protein
MARLGPVAGFPEPAGSDPERAARRLVLATESAHEQTGEHFPDAVVQACLRRFDGPVARERPDVREKEALASCRRCAEFRSHVAHWSSAQPMGTPIPRT